VIYPEWFVLRRSWAVEPFDAMMSIRLGEDFDHDHHASATGTRRPGLRAHIVIRWFLGWFLDWPWHVGFVLDLKQLATQRQIGPAPRIGKQAVMADIGTLLQKMRGEAVPQGMRRYQLIQMRSGTSSCPKVVP
jgi:hypothetical protein